MSNGPWYFSLLSKSPDGMSQDELGKGLGMTFQQIQKCEKGTNAVAFNAHPRSLPDTRNLAE